MEKRFDEGFDNILTYHYDKEYIRGKQFRAQSLVQSLGRKRYSLNGKWHFAPDVFKSTVRTRWYEEVKNNRFGEPIPYDYDFEAWDTIDVPGVWNNQRAEYALYEGAGVYFRTFSGEELERAGLGTAENTRIWLRLEGANYETRIWLNGQYLGRHLGGFTPFCVELSSLKKEENRLLILVDNTRRGEQVPSAHYDWFNYGGIFRDIYLFETPKTYLQDWMVQLSRTKEGEMEYQLRIASDSGDLRTCVDARIEIAQLGIQEEIVCTRTEEEGAVCFAAEGSFAFRESNLRKWTPKYPVCYPVQIQIPEEDICTEMIGFRRIEARGQKLFLNGRALFLRGMCVHEDSERSQRALCEEELREEFRQAKELGCNFLRLTHYPHSPMAAQIADEMGILLLEEIPVYWALEFANPQTFADAQNQLEELIRRDRNRASVIIWSVGNENPDSEERFSFMRRLVEKARTLDSTRLIGASCLIDVERRAIRDRLMDVLDVVGINEYYGWYLKDFETLGEILKNYASDKPLLITETGADAVCGYFSKEKAIYSEEYQAEVYERQFQTLLAFDFIRGVMPWVLYDYPSMRRMSALQKGYNLKGIIGKDRAYRKLAYHVVKRVYGQIEKKEGRL